MRPLMQPDDPLDASDSQAGAALSLPADAPPVERLGHHVLGALRAALDLEDPALIRAAKALALLTGYTLAHDLRQSD